MNYSPSTRLYGVIGNPVKHSASPRLFNNLFQSYNYDGVYLGFENTSVEKLIQAMRALSIGGYSITIPFKEEVMSHLDELDVTARRLGCANTVVNDGGRLVGYNFDGMGALEGLKDFFSGHSREWQDAHVVFLGNGGAVRGIFLTLVTDPDFNGRVTIAARNTAKTEKLFSDARLLDPVITDFVSLPWDALSAGLTSLSKSKNELTLIINGTSIGMSPDTEVSPVGSDFWSQAMVAYDIVYNPLHTRFLRDAEAGDAGIITGLNMFLGQARLQFLTWTGVEVSLSDMHRVFK